MVKIPVTNKIAYFKITNCRGRPVESIGGIDKVLGCRLRKMGLKTVRKLRSRTECMSKQCFLAFMKTKVNANVRQAGMAYRCLFGEIKKSVLEAKLCKMARQQEKKRVCMNMKRRTKYATLKASRKKKSTSSRSCEKSKSSSQPTSNSLANSNTISNGVTKMSPDVEPKKAPTTSESPAQKKTDQKGSTTHKQTKPNVKAEVISEKIKTQN